MTLLSARVFIDNFKNKYEYACNFSFLQQLNIVTQIPHDKS